MHTRMDTTMDHVIKTIQQDREHDRIQQVGFQESLIYQTQMSSSMIGDYNKSLDELTTRIYGVASLVEGMVWGPQPHYEV